MKKKWKKLKGLESRPNPCLCCPPIMNVAAMDKIMKPNLTTRQKPMEGKRIGKLPQSSVMPRVSRFVRSLIISPSTKKRRIVKWGRDRPVESNEGFA